MVRGSLGVRDLHRVVGQPDHDKEHRQELRVRILEPGRDQVEVRWGKALQRTLPLPAHVVLCGLQDGEIGVQDSGRDLRVDLGHEVITAGGDPHLDLGVFGFERVHESGVDLRRSLQIGRHFAFGGGPFIERVEIDRLREGCWCIGNNVAARCQKQQACPDRHEASSNHSPPMAGAYPGHCRGAKGRVFETGSKSDINLIGEGRGTFDSTSSCLLRRTNKATIEAARADLLRLPKAEGPRRCRHHPITGHGHPRQANCPRLSLPARPRRKADRIDPTRVCRPYFCPGRSALTPDPEVTCQP